MLSALNQARLAIAATYQFSDHELCDHYRSPLGSRRDLSLFQVNFYGFLQSLSYASRRKQLKRRRAVNALAGSSPFPSIAL